MRLFAITPDQTTGPEIMKQIGRLTAQRVSGLYFRNMQVNVSDSPLFSSLLRAGITPYIHSAQWAQDMPEGVGLHFRSGEAIRPPYHRHQMRTASAHDPEKAAVLLEQGVDHVYLSPLFPPISKPEDSRPVIPVEALHALLKHYGERIILLGGMIWERIEKLRQELPYDFSVGGITLFFPLS